MRISENIMVSLVSLMVVFLPAGAFHLDSKSPSQKLNTRHVRSIEPSSIQSQQQQQQQQQDSQQQQQQGSEPQSLYDRSAQLEKQQQDDLVRAARFVSTFPLEKLRYFLPAPHHESHPSKLLEQRWLFPNSDSALTGPSSSSSSSLASASGTGTTFNYPRVGRADSNFIRFGRSFSSGSKKNNFIRLGRENPRQNNFIRLGRSNGQWDSSERGLLSKVGFFPDYFGAHWARPTDLSLGLNQELIPAYDDSNGYDSQDSISSRLG